jgi:hypothetical protein
MILDRGGLRRFQVARSARASILRKAAKTSAFHKESGAPQGTPLSHQRWPLSALILPAWRIPL